MKKTRTNWMAGVALVVSALVNPIVSVAQQIPTPETYFGFHMGADRKLAHWDQLVAYYQLLGENSQRLRVVNMGPSTLGHPFLALYISSPDNMARLDELQRYNDRLTDPRGVPAQDIEQAIANGRAIVVQSMGLHSSEVAASQMAAELVYDMVTRSDAEMQRILDNTVSIIIPAFNPDGEIMVTEWYNQTVGTEYEGVGLPFLYHHYIGHDNNRDAFMQNTIESWYGAEILFREWVPQAYVDHHQMGAYGARIYVPPYADPIRPGADPLVWREMAWYGAHIAYKEEEAGKQGVVNAAIYSGWGHFGFHWITPFHNIAGMLTESASARLATPLHLHPDQLRGGSRGLPEYEAQTTFPNPWPGGWWRVRDIVEQQKISALATLDIAARNRETVLRNAYLKASRQTERGENGTPAAFIISAEQHDRLTADKLVNKLLGQGIDVQRANAAFTHEGRVYGAGSYVVSMAQPKRGVIRWLLGRTFYPDNSYTRNRDGSPIRPYDMSTDNLAEYMGVQVDTAVTAVTAPAVLVIDTLVNRGAVQVGTFGYRLDGRLNDAFRAVNALWDGDIAVRRVRAPSGSLRPGDFIVGPSAPTASVTAVARETGVAFLPLDDDPSSVSIPVTRGRVGMYQRYLGGNMDEGWTRLLLEQFDFPYETIRDRDLQGGDLTRRFDIIVLPADNANRMTGMGQGGNGSEDYPPEYRSGFGQAGLDALVAFVEAGGTLVTFAESGDLAIDALDLPIRNAVGNVPSTEFWSPGSTLRINVNNTDPLAWGMPEHGLAMFLQGNHVYQVLPTKHSDRISRVATFVPRDVLQSGWLIGEEHIANRAAVVTVRHQEGRVVLIGFRAQHRAQTHGTYKFVFNALVKNGS